VAANQQHNEILGQPADYLGPVLSQHPDWAAGDRQGNLFHPQSGKAFFDPANPEVQQYLLDLLTEIATEYDVDGIQFDYIRYPFHNVAKDEVYGFGIAARNAFWRQTYYDPINIKIYERRWREWQDFRIAQINHFVAIAAQTLREERPDLILSAAVFAIPQGDRLEQIQQNWEAWIENGEIDMLVPMTYASTTPALNNLTDSLMASFPTKGTLLLPSIRLLDLEPGVALDQQQLLRQLPTIGTALFAASNLSDRLTQSFGATPSALPHRDPLGAIAQRFRTLQQEWNLSFTEKPWQGAAQSFQLKLALLQQEPTSKNLFLTRNEWQRFRQTIAPHLNAYGKTHPYQAEVWQNRLDTIEQLLNYAD
jgi:uncharacterized lipoprotein YddW (UPF0748 family)